MQLLFERSLKQVDHWSALQGTGCRRSPKLPFPASYPLLPKVHRLCWSLACMTGTPSVDLSREGESEMECDSHNEVCPLPSSGHFPCLPVLTKDTSH